MDHSLQQAAQEEQKSFNWTSSLSVGFTFPAIIIIIVNVCLLINISLTWTYLIGQYVSKDCWYLIVLLQYSALPEFPIAQFCVEWWAFVFAKTTYMY